MSENNTQLFRIKEKINDYFRNSQSFDGIYIKEITDKHMKIANNQNYVSLTMNWDYLFQYIYKNINNFDELEKVCEDKYNIQAIFDDLSYDMCYIDTNNKYLKMWGQESNSHKRRWIEGFYSEGGKYSEFRIEENKDIRSSNDEKDLPESLLLNFSIGKVKVSVSKPSQIFKLIFLYSNRHKIETGWNYYITISLKNISKTKLNSYLQQAIFILNLYNSNILLFGSDNFIRTFPNRYDYDTSENTIVFPEALYVPPLCYYNEAINSSNESCFLYYYKVLEYFFIINQSKTIINVIESYKRYEKTIQRKENISEYDVIQKTTKNQNTLLDGIGRVYNLGESECLDKLLNNNKIKESVKVVIDEYFYDDLINKSNGSSLDSTNISISNFSKQLYSYRNSIVHGKSDYKFSSRIPNLLYERKDDEVIKYWNIIAEKLALICIKHFCFTDNELIRFEI